MVDAGTAVLSDEPPPNVALPFETVYVHITPSTGSVKAHAVIATMDTAAKKQVLHNILLKSFMFTIPFWKTIQLSLKTKH